MSISFSHFQILCTEALDRTDLGSMTVRKERDPQSRRKSPAEIKRTKTTINPKTGERETKPVVQKTRKDIGKSREAGKSTAQIGAVDRSVDPKERAAKAAAAAKEERRKAALARRAAKSGGGEVKKSTTSSKDLSKQADKLLAKKKEEPKKTESKPRRQWRTAEGGKMTRQERDKARNAEKTAAAQKTAKSAKEILAQMRSDYEKKGGKWNSKVAVQMRAKAKKAAQALGN